MSMTIEYVMSLVDAYIGLCGVGTENDFDHAEHKLRAALTALVAQARDEEAEACAEVCDLERVDALKVGMSDGANPDKRAVYAVAAAYAATCRDSIRARIAGRKVGGART